MKTVRLVSNRVVEIIPSYATPVNKWYGAAFAAQCVEADEDVTQGMIYDPVAKTFLMQSTEPTGEEIKAECSAAIKAACAEAITGGFDADVLGRGMLHYTLTEIQQKDLESRYRAIQSGATEVLWHDTSRVTHETYTAAQFTSLFNAAQRHIISCKIRSDWLEQLAHDLIDAGKYDEALAITWGTILPEEYQIKCDAQITMLLKPYATV